MLLALLLLSYNQVSYDESDEKIHILEGRKTNGMYFWKFWFLCWIWWNMIPFWGLTGYGNVNFLNNLFLSKWVPLNLSSSCILANVGYLYRKVSTFTISTGLQNVAQFSLLQFYTKLPIQNSTSLLCYKGEFPKS